MPAIGIEQSGRGTFVITTRAAGTKFEQDGVGAAIESITSVLTLTVTALRGTFQPITGDDVTNVDEKPELGSDCGSTTTGGFSLFGVDASTSF